MSRLSRRETLAGGGKAVEDADALPSLSSINPAHAKADAKLLSRVEAFWSAHKEANDSFERWLAEKHRVEALPECPAFVSPAETREAYERYLTFMKDRGIRALSDASHRAQKRQGKAVKVVFGIPAKTYQGVLAKLKIVNVGYGDGESSGDENLEVFQDHDAPWLANAIEDFDRLVAGSDMTANPDAELLRLNTEYRTLRSEIDSGKHLDAMGRIIDEASNRSHDLEKKIAGIPAKTYTGIGFKLRIAADGLRPQSPRALETDELNLESALADAERLAGAASSAVAPETTGEDPFEALAAEWTEQKAECERLAKAEEESGATGPDFPSDAATDRLGEIETRIAETPTTTILGIVTKLRAEVYVEVDYQFTTTENVIKTALAGAEYLLAQSKQ